METIPLEILRTAFAQSVIATLATQVSCYLRLASHPDVLVIDLVEALSRNAIIGDDAAARLHKRFAADDPSISPIAQRAYWEEVLKTKGIDLNSQMFPPNAATAAPAADESATPTA
jgi:hypothetical protein